MNRMERFEYLYHDCEERWHEPQASEVFSQEELDALRSGNSFPNPNTETLHEIFTEGMRFNNRTAAVFVMAAEDLNLSRGKETFLISVTPIDNDPSRKIVKFDGIDLKTNEGQVELTHKVDELLHQTQDGLALT
jgi:hypothetical protein